MGDDELPDYHLEPGAMCEHSAIYCTKNESLGQIAEKLGASWKDIAAIEVNTKRYGKLTRSTQFKRFTLLRIPKEYSQWKLKQLKKDEERAENENLVHIGGCLQCGMANRPEELLLCDGCNAPHHVACVGLDTVPECDWFCQSCLDVLVARNSHGDLECKGFTLPSPPPLDSVIKVEGQEALIKFRSLLHDYLQLRRQQDLHAVLESGNAERSLLMRSIKDAEINLRLAEGEISAYNDERDMALQKSMCRHKIEDYYLHRQGDSLYTDSYVQVRTVRGSLRINAEDTDRWNWAESLISRVVNDPDVVLYSRHIIAQEEVVKVIKHELSQARSVLQENDEITLSQQRKLRLQYAALLSEPQLSDETMLEYKGRPFPPRYLGQISVQSSEDVTFLSMLRKPNELIFLVPLECSQHNAVMNFEPQLDREFAVFARQELFDTKRDDELPMEQNGVRDAQRVLFRLLSSSTANEGFILACPCIPSTVRPRDGVPPLRCFDLSELVHDCNLDLNLLPREPTPLCMKEKGRQLRDYQEASLRWMLDKEKETDLGIAGEFWHRLLFLDPNADQRCYFYCDLTGSWALDIFDFRGDVQQRNASLNMFQMPTASILGLEMGMGKTAVAIALIIRNGPPLHRRVLPREHQLSSVDHPAYVPPPKLSNTNSQVKFLSNGTLIIVPMTLLSQWETELEWFAPNLSVLVLHNNTECPKVEAMASADILLVSTFVFQLHKGRTKAGTILQRMKKIHFHRMIIDENHQNNQAQRFTTLIGTLSVTHRAFITGTPIGARLDDLYGQICLMRLAPFHRPRFWQNTVGNPYTQRNLECLRVLRVLLSHIVCRFSKDQTRVDGEALVALPPRTVETVYLKFGCKTEKQLYDILEARSRKLLLKIKEESTTAKEKSLVYLSGLLSASRQACSHSSLIDLRKLDTMNQNMNGKFVPKISRTELRTRAGILKLAASRARTGARERMIDNVRTFQGGIFIQCPICLDCKDEPDLALPPCAHPLCSECIFGLLSSQSSTRQPTGSCPTCRDTITRSEITFLGEAVDAGLTATSTTVSRASDCEGTAKKTTELPCFIVKSADVHASVTGASTIRANWKKRHCHQIDTLVKKSQALLPTLDAGLLSSFHSSETKVGSKVACLLQELDLMMKKDSKSKCVIFSQYQPFLDILATELHARNIGFVRIDGSCRQHERADALLSFSSNLNKKVFLLTMRAGAVGLNLTSADHCFIMDVAQNSAIEEQAIDRVHRM